MEEEMYLAVLLIISLQKLINDLEYELIYILMDKHALVSAEVFESFRTFKKQIIREMNTLYPGEEEKITKREAMLIQLDEDEGITPVEFTRRLQINRR